MFWGYKKKYILIVSAITAIFAVVFSFLPLPARAQTSDARFYFSPATSSFKEGCEYEINIFADPGSNESNAANIIINYNSSELEILDDNPLSSGIQIGTGDAYDAYAENVVDPGAGTIKLTGFSVMRTLSSPRVFGVIRFKSLAGVTHANLSVLFTGVGDTLDSNIADNTTSMDLLGSVGSASYEFTTGSCFSDNNPPTIDPIYPQNYDIDVPVDSDIEVEICDNRTHDTGVDIDSVEIFVEGELYNSASGSFSYTGTPSCYTIVVDPVIDFPDDNAVSVTFRAADLAGNTSSRTIVFNIPADADELIKYIREIIKELEECEEQACLVSLPRGGVEGLIQENQGITTALLSIPAAGGFISLIPLLLELPYYILQALAWIMNLLGLKQRGKPWGIVYDSVTKAPLPRAVVRLFSGTQLVESAVTDVNGAFSFTPGKGVYTLMASKRGYIFPSTIVRGMEDGPKINIYRGGPYTVEEEKDIVKLSIPLDPREVSKTQAIIQKSWTSLVSTIRAINPVILTLGIILSLVAYIYTRETINLVFLISNVLLLGFEIYRRVSYESKWGVAVDRLGNAVGEVELGLFDNKYNRMVDVRVTDDKGRFQFVVPGDEYTLKPSDKKFAIDDPMNPKGYQVGKRTKGDILIAPKVVVRQSADDEAAGGSKDNKSVENEGDVKNASR